jgi:pimeloyl-ACP methyl ester carboxylesterase
LVDSYGYVPFAGYQTWYRIVGEAEAPGKVPLLCLHGGPGATWQHMAPYTDLAEGRRVICYDQLGCGNSAVRAPHDASMWTPELYYTMNGPSEFHVIGPLKDFDITAELAAIAVPTLLFCGEFDEVTPATLAQARDGIKGSELVVLPGCLHMSQAEQPLATLSLLRGWLAGVEGARQAG